MYYTVYRTINLVNGKTYIGRHITDDINDSYLGSGSRIKSAISKYGSENFVKEILFVFDNKEDMILKEAELVDIDYIQDNSNYNVVQGGDDGWNCKGMLCAVEIETGKNTWITSEEYKKNNYKYKHITSNTVCVLDEKTGSYSRIQTEDFNPLFHKVPSLNTVVVWDEKEFKYIRISKDKFDKNIHITSTTGSIRVLDKNTGNWERILLTEYKENKNRYKTASSGKKTVFNKNTGKTLSIDIDEYDTELHENVFGGIVVEKNGIKQYVSKEEYYSNDSLKVATYGKVTAYDKMEKRIRHVSKEEYHSNKERYEANGSGTLLVINKKTKEVSRIEKTEYLKNIDLYESFSKNKKTVWCKKEKRFMNIPKEEFNRNFHALASDKHIICNDSKGKIIFDYFGTKKDFCKIYGDTLYSVAIKETKNWQPPQRHKFSEYVGANFELIDWKQNGR